MRSIEVFVRVAELGSFSRAAERLVLSNAAASRCVAHLETVFGGRLFDRTTRKLRLTQAGQACFEHCQRILSDIAAAEDAVRSQTAEPQGTLRVVASSLFWTRKISPRLPEFLQRYPRITVHVNLTERQPDLLGEDYDVSLQFLSPPGQSMIIRRLRTLRRTLCASPAYLARAGAPAELSELARHNCLLYAHSAETVEWKFIYRGEQLAIFPNGNLRSTDAMTLRDAALAGCGIMRSPHFLIEDDLCSGRLIALLSEAQSVDPDLCAVFPSRRLVPAKLRVFLDFIEREFGEPSLPDLRERANRADSAGAGLPVRKREFP